MGDFGCAPLPAPPVPKNGGVDPLIPVIDTPRLRLRSIASADVPAILSLHANRHAMRWVGSDPITTPDEAQAFVDFAASGWRQPIPDLRWAIERCDTPGLIGTCGFRNWDTTARHAQLGYELHWKHRGCGYMDEALAELLRWSFTRMELHRVNALVHPDNLPSRRVLQRHLFHCEGMLRDAGFWHGRHHDLLVFGLLRHEFVTSAASMPQSVPRAASLAQAPAQTQTA